MLRGGRKRSGGWLAISIIPVFYFFLLLIARHVKTLKIKDVFQYLTSYASPFNWVDGQGHRTGTNWYNGNV
jgi:hypothetical protein